VCRISGKLILIRRLLPEIQTVPTGYGIGHVTGAKPRAGASCGVSSTADRADAKALQAAIQRHLVQAEVAAYCRERRCCPHCKKQRRLKDVRARRLNSLFGTVSVRGPRSSPAVAALRRGALSPLLRRSWRTVPPLNMSASWPNWGRGCALLREYCAGGGLPAGRGIN
jgi:hypothetical protein